MPPFNVVSLAYSGAVAWDNLFSTTLVWWVPNALAGLVVAPFIITWATPSAIRWDARLIAEAVICGAGLVGGTLISFNSWFVYGIQNYPLAYLPFPFLVWGALRFGQRGATTGTLLVSALAIYSLLHRRGPFVTHTRDRQPDAHRQLHRDSGGDQYAAGGGGRRTPRGRTRRVGK